MGQTILIIHCVDHPFLCLLYCCIGTSGRWVPYFGEKYCINRGRSYYCPEDGSVTLFFENCCPLIRLQAVIKKKIIVSAKVEIECPAQPYHMRKNRILLYNVRVVGNANESLGKEIREPDVCTRPSSDCADLVYGNQQREDEPTRTEITSKLIF